MPPRPRQDPLTGHWALDAHGRAQRPRGTQPACPFCAGNEALTPPTLERVPGGGPWSARAFNNAFPLVERHEVLVDTPRHVALLHDLTEPESRAAVDLWARRLRAARAAGLAPLLYRNDGPSAGASIPHAHAQLVATGEPLPQLTREAEAFRHACPLEAPDRWTERRDEAGLVVARPAGPRFAGETWILPAAHQERFEELADAARDRFAGLLLAEARALARTGLAAYNVVLHTSPAPTADFHWHAEILPRRDAIAGFELGAGAFVNPGI